MAPKVANGYTSLPISLQIGDYKVWDYLVEVGTYHTSLLYSNLPGDVSGVYRRHPVSSGSGLCPLPRFKILPLPFQTIFGPIL